MESLLTLVDVETGEPVAIEPGSTLALVTAEGVDTLGVNRTLRAPGLALVQILIRGYIYPSIKKRGVIRGGVRLDIILIKVVALETYSTFGPSHQFQVLVVSWPV